MFVHNYPRDSLASLHDIGERNRKIHTDSDQHKEKGEYMEKIHSFPNQQEQNVESNWKIEYNNKRGQYDNQVPLKDGGE